MLHYTQTKGASCEVLVCRGPDAYHIPAEIVVKPIRNISDSTNLYLTVLLAHTYKPDQLVACFLLEVLLKTP